MLTYLQLTGRVYGNDIKQFGVWGYKLIERCK